MKILLQKTTLIIICNKQKQSEVFREKNVLLYKHNFSLAMMAGEFLPIRKEVASRKKEICVKLIYSIKTNTSISFFSKFLVKFLRNSIKYVVSRAVLGALSDLLKVESTFESYGYWKRIFRWFFEMKVKMNMQRWNQWTREDFCKYCVW